MNKLPLSHSFSRVKIELLCVAPSDCLSSDLLFYIPVLPIALENLVTASSQITVLLLIGSLESRLRNYSHKYSVMVSLLSQVITVYFSATECALQVAFVKCLVRIHGL